MSESEKKDQMKKVNGIFEMHVTNNGKTEVYTIDLKKVRRANFRLLRLGFLPIPLTLLGTLS